MLRTIAEAITVKNIIEENQLPMPPVTNIKANSDNASSDNCAYAKAVRFFILLKRSAYKIVSR